MTDKALHLLLQQGGAGLAQALHEGHKRAAQARVEHHMLLAVHC